MTDLESGPIFNRAAGTYDEVVPMFAHFGRRIVDAAPLLAGDRVLDIASGRGATLFPALERVGPSGAVTGIDIAPEMVRLTREDIARGGFENARLTEMDARDVQFPDASFDAVIIAFAIFLIPGPELVLKGIHRVLRAGGSVTLATWVGEDPRWAWLGAVAGPLLCPGSLRQPDPYREEGSLPAALHQAGLEVSSVTESEDTLHFHDLDHWMAWMRSHGGLMLMEALGQKEGALAAFKQAAERETAKFRDDNGIPVLQRARYTVAIRPA